MPVVKICGLSKPDALTATLAAGADMIGFVFFPPSPRHVTWSEAETLARLFDQAAPLAARRPQKVALTVDADDDWIAAAIGAVSPDLLQLHGRETPERVAAIKARFALPVIKAVLVESRDDVALAHDYYRVADWILFDARAPAGATRPGGFGRAFDWTLITHLPKGPPLMLSGGLTPDNVAEALRVTQVDGVDVSSGVESAPGVKDAGKIARFVAAARASTPVA